MSSSNSPLEMTQRMRCCTSVLGTPGVDGVVRHLVADAVGAPAQRELGQVAGADDEAAAVVGEAEEVVVAQPGLDVLEGDVVDLLAVGVGVVEVLEHLLGGRP